MPVQGHTMSCTQGTNKPEKHTIPTFNDLKEEGFGKHCGKSRKCCLPASPPLPSVFSTLLTLSQTSSGF